MAKVNVITTGIISIHGWDSLHIKAGSTIELPDAKVARFIELGYVAPLGDTPTAVAADASPAPAQPAIEKAADAGAPEVKELEIELPDFAMLGKKKVLAFAKEKFDLVLDSDMGKDKIVEAIEVHVAEIKAAAIAEIDARNEELSLNGSAESDRE